MYITVPSVPTLNIVSTDWWWSLWLYLQRRGKTYKQIKDKKNITDNVDIKNLPMEINRF